MNETLILEIIFWSALFMVFYTYLGLRHRPLRPRQTERAFRETRETGAATGQ